jgi:DNA-binding transcriptional LysR family regulator
VRGPVEKNTQRGVARKTAQPIGPALLERISWDDLRVFMVVARTLSFRKAATALRANPATVLRRVERLEEFFGFRLFDRIPDGLILTAQGEAVYRSALEMERASLSLRAHLDQDLATRGMVRCAVTEGLGTMWILPHLAQFSRTHPTTVVDLRCSMDVADVLRMEADVAVQLQQPDRPDVKSLRLGRLHIYPFASKRYIELYGLPKTIDELKHHRLIHQKAPQVEEHAWAKFLDDPSIENIVALRTNASTALACAIEFGIGIGPLPTYIVAIGTDLVPVDIGVRHHVDIWMTYHPDARSIRRVSFFIDWLRTLFDARRYPWFGDEFIHPRELAKSHAPKFSETLLNLPIIKHARRAAG